MICFHLRRQKSSQSVFSWLFNLIIGRFQIFVENVWNVLLKWPQDHLLKKQFCFLHVRSFVLFLVKYGDTQVLFSFVCAVRAVGRRHRSSVWQTQTRLKCQISRRRFKGQTKQKSSSSLQKRFAVSFPLLFSYHYSECFDSTESDHLSSLVWKYRRITVCFYSLFVLQLAVSTCLNICTNHWLRKADQYQNFC